MGSTMFETFNLEPYEDEVKADLQRAAQDRLVGRLWEKDHTLWQEEDREVSNRLGWLEAPDQALAGLARWQETAADVRRQGIRQVLLLGMGGASMAAEVLSCVFGPAPGHPRLAVLDSTAPSAVGRWRDSLSAEQTLFIVSSKSGTTIETLTLFKFFFHWQGQRLGPGRAGPHFLAITDPGTPLEKTARQLGFRDVVPGVPSIGGRFSAFSPFGLLPAALLGLDGQNLVTAGRNMARLCREEAPGRQNPGLFLGTLLARLAVRGLDKLTLLLPSRLESLAGWLEQLIAESTGKRGRGILPVVEEVPLDLQAMSPDRLFVLFRVGGDDTTEPVREALRARGKPMLTIDLRRLEDVAGQFFLWEMAVAVAGHWLGVNPFEQPDVTAAKRNTEAMVDHYSRFGRFPLEQPSAHGPGVTLYGPEIVASAAEGVRRFAASGRPGDYVCLLAFLDPEPDMRAALAKLAVTLRRWTGLAVTVGFGPRYLHSTGQLHKGDAGRGLFFQFTSSTGQDLAVSGGEDGRTGPNLTFGALLEAQARGDYLALRQAGRRALRLDFSLDPVEALGRVGDWLR